MVFNPACAARRAATQTEQNRGIVVLYCPPRRKLHHHEWQTHLHLARQIAVLQDHAFGGEFDPALCYDEPLYFVPSETLLLAEANALGIEKTDHLFGGVVPFAFVATKTITHGLTNAASCAPPGWSTAFSEQVCQHVLPGFTAFTAEDAKHAAAVLFRRGSIRLKLPDGIGGAGQAVMKNASELEDYLHPMDKDALAQNGIVVETNLNEVVTYSVGQCLVGTKLITYCGTQRLTANNHGKQVYGGSELLVVRGDFDKLLQRELDERMRTAISQAGVYHRAALAAYPEMFVSRANYDVAQGVDDSGHWHSGVLEQSWRIGGATAAEVAALEAFHAQPDLDVVWASTTELYGNGADLPEKARVYYQGIDDSVGPLTKYALIRDYVDVR